MTEDPSSIWAGILRRVNLRRMRQALLRQLKQRALAWSLPLPFSCRHIEHSIIAATDDDPGRPSERLLDIAIQAIDQARNIDLSWLCSRMSAPPYYPEIWPGEHYKLLAALVMVHRPKRIVEIGTFQGLSALAMKSSAAPGSEVITVDITPWSEIPGSAFCLRDFEGGGLRQVVGDLSDARFFSMFADIISGCDLLFVDGPKNAIFEATLLRHLDSVELPAEALVLFDDIRLWNMLRIWRGIQRPKLDLTSFGHWSGTGIVHWNGPSGEPLPPGSRKRTLVGPVPAHEATRPLGKQRA